MRNKIKLFILFTLFFLLSLQAYAADSTRVLPFKPGENLTFRIRYGFITAGIAHMRVLPDEQKFNQQVMHIQTTAKNVPAFGWIYPVDDVINVLLDPLRLRPLYYEKKLREGTYKADLFVTYEHADSVARVRFIRYNKDMKIKKEEEFPVKIPADAFDVLSAFYYIRTLPLVVGQSYYLTGHQKKKVYDLQVKVHRREELEVEAGTFNCLVVEPMLKGEGIFKQKGRLLIWLTDDSLHIPVQMTSKVVVGHITTELTAMNGVPAVIPARIK